MDLPKALIPFCGNVGQVESKALLARQWVICVVIQPVMTIWNFQESNFDGHGFSELKSRVNEEEQKSLTPSRWLGAFRAHLHAPQWISNKKNDIHHRSKDLIVQDSSGWLLLMIQPPGWFFHFEVPRDFQAKPSNIYWPDGIHGGGKIQAILGYYIFQIISKDCF